MSVHLLMEVKKYIDCEVAHSSMMLHSVSQEPSQFPYMRSAATDDSAGMTKSAHDSHSPSKLHAYL